MPTATSSLRAPATPADATLGVVVRPQPAGGRYLAVVHTADDIRFRETSIGRDDLVDRLAEYVLLHAPDRLWPHEADRVRALLACGDRDAAIASYFARVGRRWDKEWLITTVIDADG